MPGRTRDTKTSSCLQVFSLVGNKLFAQFVPLCSFLELKAISISILFHLCRSLGFVPSSSPAQLSILWGCRWMWWGLNGLLLCKPPTHGLVEPFLVCFSSRNIDTQTWPFPFLCTTSDLGFWCNEEQTPFSQLWVFYPADCTALQRRGRVKDREEREGWKISRLTSISSCKAETDLNGNTWSMKGGRCCSWQ